MTDLTWQWAAVAEHWPAVRTGFLVNLLLLLVVLIFGGAGGLLLAAIVTPRQRWLAPLRWAVLAPLGVINVLPILVVLVVIALLFPGAAAWLHQVLEAVATRFAGGAGDPAGPPPGGVLGALASEPFAIAALALLATFAARTAIIVRRSVRDVNPRLIELADTLGMGSFVRASRVVGPAAFRACLPQLVRETRRVFCYTTLAAFVGCREIVATIMGVLETGERRAALELSMLLVAGFLITILPLVALLRWTERSRWFNRRASALPA